jgi:polysaccharide pyruvyl transferase WcaK-like protein
MGVLHDKVKEAGDDASSLPRAAVVRSPVRTISICLRVSSFHRAAQGERFLFEWNRFLAQIEGMDWWIRFFSFHENRRFEITRYEEFIARAGLKRATIIQEPDPRDLRARVAECHAAVCNTFHGALFALSEGLPTLALWHGDYYRNKIGSLLRQYGRPEWAVQVETFNAMSAARWASAVNVDSERTHLMPRAAMLASANDASLIKAYELATLASCQRAPVPRP